MMELNREQVVKALECCTSESSKCADCPRFGFIPCTKPLLTDALALIKEITDSEDYWKRQAFDACMDKERMDNKIKELTEENERLREDNEIKSQKRANIFEILSSFERGRADGVRKMRDMLCEGRVSNDPVVIAAKVTAKEMLEEKQ